MRRHPNDPLTDIRRAHWLTISDLHRSLIACTEVPAGTDLRATLRDALAAQAADGWHAESDGAYGFAFIAKGSERRLVNLTPADPSVGVGSGHGFLAGQGGGTSCEEPGRLV